MTVPLDRELAREPSLDDVLESWIARFRGPLVGLLASWGASWGEADDLAQDTFVEAWLGRERLRGDPADSAVVGPWLRGIAFNLLRAQRRRSRREPLACLPAEVPAPYVTHDERLDDLRAAFAKLRAPLQTVLRMFYLDHTSTREVAALLGITEKAVESRLRHARHALRARLERVHPHDEGPRA